MIVLEFSEMVECIEDCIDSEFFRGTAVLKQKIIEILKESNLVAKTVEDELKEDICKKLKSMDMPVTQLEATLNMIFPGEF